MNNLLNDIITNKNGIDFCAAKTLMVISVLMYVVYSGIGIYRGDKFDPASWGGGISTIIVAGCSGAKIKQSTEPE